MKKNRILIVEDEHDCAELLRYHLQKDNYQTEIARSGKEAIEAVERQMPDAVLLDIMLPELNGWEVCRILREGPNGKSLPIIMLTALSDEKERVDGLSLGADDYLAKPYSMKELLLKLRKLLDRQETVQELKIREQQQDTTLRYIVHELKSSLHVIGGFSSHALRRDDSNKYLQTINTAVAQAEKVLNEAPFLSQTETSGERLTARQVETAPLVSEPADCFPDDAKTKTGHRQFNAVSLVSGIAETARILVGDKPISVKVTTPLMDVMISTDNVKLSQILTNLVSNAVKFTEQGQIAITLSVIGSWMEISVSDTGIGIQEKDLHKLFTAHGRIMDTKNEGQTGMGFGLKISKDLAAQLGGTIAVTSKYGKGTTFIVSLPLQQADGRRGLYSTE